MDSFYCVEEGIFCSADQFAKSLMNFVFPELHPYNISTITTCITKIIWENLSHRMPKEVSLRVCCNILLHYYVLYHIRINVIIPFNNVQYDTIPYLTLFIFPYFFIE